MRNNITYTDKQAEFALLDESAEFVAYITVNYTERFESNPATFDHEDESELDIQYHDMIATDVRDREITINDYLHDLIVAHVWESGDYVNDLSLTNEELALCGLSNE